MGKVTMHILDTMHGCPGAKIRYELSYIHRSDGITPLDKGLTNEDGRTDRPILENDRLVKGRYALKLYTAEYFRARGVDLPDPPFFDEITIEFAVADPDSHYHVPLLVSPYSYSTYRGS